MIQFFFFDTKIGEKVDALHEHEETSLLLSISRDDYESLPKHMKGLASWEV